MLHVVVINYFLLAAFEQRQIGHSEVGILIFLHLSMKQITTDWHIIGSLSGFLGGTRAFYMGLYAYIADVSSGIN